MKKLPPGSTAALRRMDHAPETAFSSPYPAGSSSYPLAEFQIVGPGGFQHEYLLFVNDPQRDFGVLLEALVEGHLHEYLGRRRMDRAIDGMTGHVIVCGWGRVGAASVAHLGTLGEFDIQDADLTGLKEKAPQARMTVVPNGVDLEEFRPDGTNEAGVAFVGGTSPFPNFDALQFFCDQILPHLRRARPALRNDEGRGGTKPPRRGTRRGRAARRRCRRGMRATHRACRRAAGTGRSARSGP